MNLGLYGQCSCRLVEGLQTSDVFPEIITIAKDQVILI